MTNRVVRRKPVKKNVKVHRDEETTKDSANAAPEPFDLALIEHYSASPNWRRYRKLVELGASNGDPLAIYAVATWYLLGEPYLGIRPHPTRWVGYLRTAARSSNRAMYDLAVSKMAGFGMARDRRGAYRLFARAAELGCVSALLAQSQCLMDGTGVRVDRPRGQKLAQRAKSLLAKMRRLK